MTPEKARILVVDDDEQVRKAVSRFLERTDDFIVTTAENGHTALESVEGSEPCLALLDIRMPGMDGFELMEKLKERFGKLPVVFITGSDEVEYYRRAFFSGADDYITKPFDQDRVIEVINRAIYYNLAAQTLPNNDHISVAAAWGRGLNFRDSTTGCHSERVATTALFIGREMDLEGQDLTRLLIAAWVHDVGKMGVSDAVLLKPGKLDAAEWQEMKTHAQKSYDILREITLPEWEGIALSASTHHENWGNGKGYPFGLKGDEIPRDGCIIAAADIWDALRSRRPYKEPMPAEHSLDLMKKLEGKNLRPDVVEAFFRAYEKGRIIADFSTCVNPFYAG